MTGARRRAGLLATGALAARTGLAGAAQWSARDAGAPWRRTNYAGRPVTLLGGPVLAAAATGSAVAGAPAGQRVAAAVAGAVAGVVGGDDDPARAPPRPAPGQGPRGPPAAPPGGPGPPRA